MKENWPVYFFLFLLICFFAFSYHLYSSNKYSYRIEYEKPIAQQGELVWQKYNCQSCHQLYGLGGYLGTDLTNLISSKGKNESYILAIIKTGSAQMPSFDLSENEKKELIEFFKLTDASGISDPRNNKPTMGGMISKDEN